MFEDSLEGKSIINFILSDPNMLRANYDAWKQWFSVDPNITPTAADGTASLPFPRVTLSALTSWTGEHRLVTHVRAKRERR
jgi:hypothetical protein